MTPMELPNELTYGEAYNPAMAVETEEQARDYFYALIRRNIRVTGNSWTEAERVERVNVGYWSGYFDHDTMQRVARLYGFGHPLFGTTPPSAERAVEIGRALGELSQAIDGSAVNIEAFGRAVQQSDPEHRRSER